MPDILIDAGPLIALISRGDRHHGECSRLFRELDCPFLTTLPVITEAMHLLFTYGGLTGQSALWRLVLRGDLVLAHPEDNDLVRMDQLMTKYGDLPMDFADASLVAIAERTGLTRVFTLDRADFTVYRRNGRSAFKIIGPSPSPKRR